MVFHSDAGGIYNKFFSCHNDNIFGKKKSVGNAGMDHGARVFAYHRSDILFLPFTEYCQKKDIRAYRRRRNAAH